MDEVVPPLACNTLEESVEGASEPGDGSLALISEALEQVMQERKSDGKIGVHKKEKAVDEHEQVERKNVGDQRKERVETSEKERDEAGDRDGNLIVRKQDSGNEENEQENDDEEEEEGGEDDKTVHASKRHVADLSLDSPTDAPTRTDSARSSPTPSTVEEFVEVDLSDIRKDVQCPICLGIIRKTRTVMECLHRFCRECIDKSMRLGNNECPVCRTHCASRRSLRDDLNFDAIIAALYPNVDVYEEEEFALREENERRNKQLQESIAETLERQSDATRRCTAKPAVAVVVRKVPNKVRNLENQNKGKTQSYGGGDDEAYEEYEQPSNIPETTTRERRSRRRKRDTATLQMEAATDDEQVGVPTSNKFARVHSIKSEEVKGEASVSNVGRWEGLATWARAGSRSAPRSGNMNSSNNSRLMTRATLLLEALSAATRLEREIEFDVHLTLQPFNHDDYYEKLPSLDKPYLCCPANVTVQHVCEFLVHRLPIDPDEELELILGNNDGQDQPNVHVKQKAGHDGGEIFRLPEILHPQATLGQIHEILWHCHGNLVLMYRRRM